MRRWRWNLLLAPLLNAALQPATRTRRYYLIWFAKSESQAA